ncbi:FAD-dependent oxidoreductase [Jannaschia sp. LMIT008]|uniref:NAD(P)/FAD-dependent oxidoreductase n=1 Tax=Jannaschia maritima TaxID=3032585 RepID=UPI0028123A9D|nr:FAD-dependent oxidoreductase [Jannaschia sp. LMIT008]
MSPGHAVVIGRGVIGCAVALELARDGWAVTSVDRHAAAGHGSTSGSSGVIRTFYSSRMGTALAWEGLHGWRDWAGHVDLPPGTPLAPYRETGMLVLATEGNDRLAAQRAASDDLGIPWDWWDADALRDRTPFLDLTRYGPARRPEDEGFGEPTGGTLREAVFWPGGGYVSDPMLAAQNLWHAAARAGAVAVTGEIAGIRADDRVRAVVLSDGAEVAGDVVVNVAGPGSRRINALAGVLDDMAVTTAPMRQEVVHLPGPPGVDYGAAGLPMSDDDAGVYSRPERGGVLVGTQEPACDPLDWVEDERAVDRAFTAQWDVQAMRMAQRIPTLPLPRQASGVVELYDVSTDWIPIYDRSSLDGFFMACGTSGNQFKCAPIAGRLMAEVIRHVWEEGDQDADPVQVRAPRTGVTLDTGFWSRRRTGAATSGSVLG